MLSHSLCRAHLCKGCQLCSGKLSMWPFEKVLWWYCRPKGSPKDHHGEVYQRQLRMRCKKALDRLTPSCISARLCSWKLSMWPFEKVLCLWWYCRPKGSPKDKAVVQLYRLQHASSSQMAPQRSESGSVWYSCKH